LTEVMRSGGYELVTLEKNWKKIALSLGKNLATQTSASFALRTHYQVRPCAFPKSGGTYVLPPTRM
jgi:hypothetical protein